MEVFDTGVPAKLETLGRTMYSVCMAGAKCAKRRRGIGKIPDLRPHCRRAITSQGGRWNMSGRSRKMGGNP